MKTHNISLINGFVLIIIGLFGYFKSELRPITALIPVFFGTFIVLMNNGVKKENKLLNSYCFLEPKFSEDELYLFDEI